MQQQGCSCSQLLSPAWCQAAFLLLGHDMGWPTEAACESPISGSSQITTDGLQLQGQQRAAGISQCRASLGSVPIPEDSRMFLLGWQEARINGNGEILLNTPFHHFPLCSGPNVSFLPTGWQRFR